MLVQERLDASQAAAEQLEHQPHQLLRLLSMLGPGLVTGASDDDPTGILTYSVAGAQLGFAMLWTALVTFRFMAAVQYTCAKIGFARGMGMAGVLRKHYPPGLVYLAVAALLVANTITAGADLGAIAAAVNLVVPSVPIVLLVGPIAVVIVQPNWSEVLTSTFVPRISFDRVYLTTLVAILGTTISPYLFFWETSHYIEEQVARGRIFVWQRAGADAMERRCASRPSDYF